VARDTYCRRFARCGLHHVRPGAAVPLDRHVGKVVEDAEVPFLVLPNLSQGRRLEDDGLIFTELGSSE
jgi:hypothetical protein